ncbi:MAG: glycosyltransferase [Chthoniobacteraceae bacterium]
MPVSPNPASFEKPSLLIVSHTYLATENRKKIAAMAEHFEVTCAAPGEIKTPLGKLGNEHHGQDPRYTMHFMETVGDPIHTTRYFLKGLKDIMRQKRFDVVLAEVEPWSYLRWQAWWLKRRFLPEALFGEFTWENIERSGMKGRIVSLFYQAAAATNDFLIAGNGEASAIFQKYGMQPRSILVAPQLGVDETSFTETSTALKEKLRAETGLPKEAFLIGFCGRFEAYKGLLDLIAAAELVRAQKPEQDVHLVFLGNGPLRPEIEQASREKPWIHLLPPRPHSEIATYLQSLDLLALPSREIHDADNCWKEQFGHVLIEAMSCGVPVVGSDSGAIPEVIGDSRMIHREGNPDSLAECLLSLLKNPGLLAEVTAGLRARVLEHYTNSQLAAKWSRFMQHRVQAEKKSILWVDPHFSLKSPSMKHLIYSIPKLLEAGWDLRAWCLEADAEIAGVSITKLKRLRIPEPLMLFWFFFVSHFHGAIHRLLKGRKPATISHTNGGLYLWAEIVSFHFFNKLWLRRQMELGFANWKEFASFCLHFSGRFFDYCQLHHSRCRLLLPVSDSIGEALQDDCNHRIKSIVLPNAYDEARFHPGVRHEWRAPMRQKLGFSDDQVVFTFTSQGHYRRKGFWLAAEALHLIRQNPTRRTIRFLVIGGKPETLATLQAELDQRFADWREWIVFVGSQPQVEHYLAAADAFLFPSYFEAFCLAEIEASALGLPLLLTPHHGTEMILKPGVNGLLLDYDAAAMARTLELFLKEGMPPFVPGGGRALTRGQYAGQICDIYQRFIAEPSGDS